MTYRERRERRAERLRDWAAKRETKSAAAFDRARVIADGIPLGQPILVGHHSEKRHRRDLAKIDAGMSAGVEHQRTAERMTSRAGNIEDQLERSIYDDDPDAVERLEEKAAALDEKRDRMKAANVAYRKGDAAKFAALGYGELEKVRERLNRPEVMPWCRMPHAAYELQNLGAVIRKARERVAIIKQRRTRAEEVEAAGGFRITRLPRDERYSFSVSYCYVQFSEKPARDVINALKAAGFRWGRDRWSGETDKLPACVLELEELGGGA